MNLEESTVLALSEMLNESLETATTYTCIEDRQHGDFCVGATMTAEEWGETAMAWAESDGWSDPEEPLLKNFKTEQDCINFIDDMWEITIVPSNDPQAKKFLDEARRHKKDNEKAAPRNREQSFNGGPNGLSVKASGIATNNAEKIKTGISRVAVGPEKGDIVNRDIKRNRVRSAEQALNRKNAGQLDFAGTNDMLNYEVAPNQKSREYRKSLGMITRENKKQEARSHKEDNEKAAPRENTKQFFGELGDVPKRARHNGKDGWGYYDADDVNAHYNGISKDIQAFKDLRRREKTARDNQEYYSNDFDRMNKFAKSALERDDEKDFDRLTRLARKSGRLSNTFKKSADELAQQATDLVKTKSRNELTEGKLLMTGYDAGMCPKCHTPIFEYGDIEWFDDSIGQSFICQNCNLKGTEYFNISFDCIELEKPELEEAKNPENAEINDKIKKSFNGSTKHIDDIEKAGLNVFQNEKGKVQAIGKPEGTGMTKDDFKKSHPDMDYYNYMTKEKVKPEEVATGAFSPTNIFRDSTNFNKTIGGRDRTYLQTDNNGVSKAIPKRYKTGNSNTSYNPNEFPHKSLNGVASYEPLNNTELSTFKSDKPGLEYSKYVMDKAKDEYEKKKAEYDKINARVSQVRDRIAKSKENSKK